MKAMLVTERPALPLASRVECLWFYDGHQQPSKDQRERVLPNARFQVVIDVGSGAGAVSGMRSRYVTIQTAAIQPVIGIVFRPGGARSFFDAPASDFFNLPVPLDSVWGSRLRHLHDRLQDAVSVSEKFGVLQSFLLHAVARDGGRRRDLHPTVHQALEEFRGSLHTRSVVEAAAHSGLSRRRLSQLFREQVGMTPKMYCRVRRFLRVAHQIASAGPVEWADLALAGGYSDQAHMIHEFQEFAGLTPTAFLAAERPSANHVRVA
jgi:AraC-like DNA-binding protein